MVTGSASGFGRETVVRLLARGWTVHGVDERPPADGWADGLSGLVAARVDVRSDADVAGLAASVGDVDLLVNNAGYAAFGTQEELPIDVVRDLFDVNVLGPARTARALLPGLRRRRGTVVQLSSVAGRTVFPESGFYAATKHALEAMSEALAQEVAGWGVRVRLIEPGSFATGFSARAAAASPAPDPDSPYAAARERWSARKSEVLEPPQPPAWVADAILASLDDPAPFLRVPVGVDARRILGLRDAVGPDGFVRVALERAGHSGPGDLDPGRLAGLPEGHPDLRLAAAARDHGHLGHWEASAAGRAALARLPR